MILNCSAQTIETNRKTWKPFSPLANKLNPEPSAPVTSVPPAAGAMVAPGSALLGSGVEGAGISE